LADTGHWEEAYAMLLRERMPSWLYQVRHGATSVWERWDAIRPDGSIHPGTMSTPPEMAERSNGEEPNMLSFNHYAYGAVIDWVYRHVAGLAPDRAQPGYRHVIAAPRPAQGFDHASARLVSAYGPVSIAWRLDEADRFDGVLEVPFGAYATFVPPVSASSVVVVDGRREGSSVTLGPGRHEFSVSAADVVRRWPAVETVEIGSREQK
jgi:alpha-L-rhamnosidase